ncbi:MAG: hypothetical protein ACM3OO_11560 [Planctomycetaceae bacterium]
MRGISRAALWVVFGVVVAVALSAGAFAVANGSIGEPAGPVSVAPQGSGDKAPESDHPTPSLQPTPSAEQSKGGQHQGPGSSSGSSTSTSTSTATSTGEPSAPSSSPSHEDRGGNGEDD